MFSNSVTPKLLNSFNMKNKVEILIAEDSFTQALEMQHFLEQYHYSVSVVRTGKEAIDLLKIRRPSIIISDIVMPEMDGFELCRFIKGSDTLSDIPVILLTGLSDPADIVQGLAAGAEDYILKPYDNKCLLEKIELLLSNPFKKDRDDGQEDMDISFGGRQFTISASRKQILHLLISTYENVIRKNKELVDAHGRLEGLNNELEKRLKELEVSQANLQMSEERFRILVQMVPDIVYRIDANGYFTFINNAVQQLGYLPSELIGRHFSSIMSEEDAKRVSRETVLKKFEGTKTGVKDQPKLFDEKRTGERITRCLEIKLIPKTGKESILGVAGTVGDEIVIVEINSSGMYEKRKKEKDQQFAGTVGVVRDITERKLAEDAITHLNKELEQKVIERTKTLYKSKQDLEKALEDLNITRMQVIQSEKLAAIGTLIAGITHELNNPLMSVMNYVQYVSEKTEDKRLLGYLEKAGREANRACDIVRNLLSYSRPPTPDLAQIRCKDVIYNVIDLLDLDFRNNNIKVIVNIPYTLPTVRANRDSLQQVFLNILINARDAMSDSQKKEVYIDGGWTDNNIQISIRDTGCGISPKIIRKIFDPFFTTKEPGKGTGLGLSVSYNIINGFGGMLTCESIDENGTKFIVTLPAGKSG